MEVSLRGTYTVSTHGGVNKLANFVSETGAVVLRAERMYTVGVAWGVTNIRSTTWLLLLLPLLLLLLLWMQKTRWLQMGKRCPAMAIAAAPGMGAAEARILRVDGRTNGWTAGRVADAGGARRRGGTGGGTAGQLILL